MRRLFAAVALMACAPESAAERRPDVARDLEAQLAVVARPEPRGSLRVQRAATLHAPTRIARDDVWLDVTPIDLHDAPFVNGTAHVEGTEVVHVVSGGRFEELRRVHRALDRIELRYAVALGDGLVRLRVVDDHVEAVDARGVARLRTEPAFAVDAKQTVRALVPRLTKDGVAWSADAHDLVPPIAIDPAWTTTKSLARPASAAAFPLPGKKVIVVEDALAKTEIYDDATASWTDGPSLSVARVGSPAQLDDGRIFVAGGAGESPALGEILDAAATKWTTTVASPYGYGAPTVVALKSARALVVQNASASIYDAAANTWTKTAAAPVTARRGACGLPLKDGRVLLAGGASAGVPLASAELFDPATGTFAAAGSMSVARTSMGCHVLADGRVIVVGGADPATGTILDSTELFEPTTKNWSAGPKMTTARRMVSGVVMADGRLLVAGGFSTDALLASAEIFDPTASKWYGAGALSEPRGDIGMAPIGAGASRYIAVGGYNGGYSTTADVFELALAGKACKDAGECASLSCVDGVCCQTSACAADETCGGTSAPGVCKKKTGTACSSGDACANGLCVDGVCCDRACDGLCEACDLASSKGTCATLAPGDSPHGTRGKCPGDGPCAATCGGSDAKACTLFPGATTACGAATCKDGVETSASSCDGAGKCQPPVTQKCEPFTCAETACKRACAADSDCAGGYSCDARSGRCVFGAKCDGDHTVQVPGASALDCTPFKCAGAACLSRCSTTDECIAGTTCDTSSGACVVAAPADSGGGCSYGGRTRTPIALLGVALLLGVAARRRSR